MENQKKTEHKYNYIFFSVSEDYLVPMFYGLNELENVEIRECGLPKNRLFLNKILKLHFSTKINKIIKLPLKRIWFSMMCENHFKNDKPTCFVFFGPKYVVPDCGFIEYIRKKNSKNKIVVQFCDLIKGEPLAQMKKIKSDADMVSTYDKEDAAKNGIEYLEETMYGRQLELSLKENFKSDLFFLGYSKGRLELLLKVCEYLQAHAVRCDFRIVGVPQNEQVPMQGVTYLDKPMKYLDYIREIQDTRCLLEMPQANSVDITMRTVEAIAYKRKLLTNATHIVDSQYYVFEQMKVFEKPEDIDIEFLKSPNDYDAFENNFDMSPEKRLRFIEEHIS